MTCSNCEKFQKRVEALEGKIRELEAKLAFYENPHTPSSLQRCTLRPVFQNNRGMGVPGRRKGHEGVTRKTPNPDRVVRTMLEKCPHCDARLGSPTRFKSRVIEEIPEPQPLRVTRFELAEYECPGCKTKLVAGHPECPREGIFGLNALARATIMKFEDRLPHRKVVEALKREHGLIVTPASVLDMTRRVTGALRKEYEQILSRIRASGVMYVDETSIRVSGVNYWTWSFTNERDTLIVVRKSRGKKVLQEVLGKGYDGVIVCDGWRSYPNFTNKIQRCWAHLLREANDAAEKFLEAAQFYNALKRMYDRLVLAVAAKPPPEERERLKRNARGTLCYWLGKAYKEEKVTKFMNKVRNGLNHWFTFVTTPGVEPTNNRAERALREHVVIRKIIGTLRNVKGTKIHETIISVLATWKQHELNTLKTLTNHLQQNYT